MPDLYFQHAGLGKHEIKIETDLPPDGLSNDPDLVYVTIRSGRRIFRLWASAISNGYDDGAYLMLGEQRGPFRHEKDDNPQSFRAMAEKHGLPLHDGGQERIDALTGTITDDEEES